MPGNVPKNETYLGCFILDILRGLNLLLVGSGKDTNISSLWFFVKKSFLLFKGLCFYVTFMSLIIVKTFIKFFTVLSSCILT